MTPDQLVAEQRRIISGWHTHGKPSSWSEPPYLGFMPKFPHALRKIKLAGPAIHKILDVGCYTGYWLRRLQKDGYECHGIDLQKDLMNRLAAENSGITYTFGSAEKLPHRSGYFDCVTAFDVLEHTLDPDAAVSEMLRVLRPGGLLLIALPRNDLYPDDSGEHLFTFPFSAVQEKFGIQLGGVVESIEDEHRRAISFITVTKPSAPETDPQSLPASPPPSQT